MGVRVQGHSWKLCPRQRTLAAIVQKARWDTGSIIAFPPEGFEHRTIHLVARTISGFKRSLFCAVMRCIKFAQRLKNPLGCGCGCGNSQLPVIVGFLKGCSFMEFVDKAGCFIEVWFSVSGRVILLAAVPWDDIAGHRLGSMSTPLHCLLCHGTPDCS